jgi:hypothetical protein
MLCHAFRVVTIRRDLDWMIGFFDTSYTHLGTIGNYSAITDLHTLPITRTFQVFSVFTSRILVTDFNTVIIPVSL